MRSILHYVGIGLLAVGTGCILFWLYLNASLEKPLLSPIPQENPLHVIYITPRQ